MDERRKWVRVDCELPCRYDDAPHHAVNQPEKLSSAITKDVSEGGGRFYVFEFLPVGHRIRMCLELPLSEPIETLLEIMWISEVPHSQGRFQVGGRFTTLAEDQHQEIRQFLYKKTLNTLRYSPALL